MNGSALEKLAPLSGAVWFVLLAVGAVLIGIYDYLPSPESITESLTDNADMASVGGYVGVLGVFFLIWFGGSVRGALAEKEPRGRLSEIAFGGALAAALAMGAGFATLTIAAQRAGSSGGIGTVEAVALYDMWSGITGLLVPVCLAVLVGAVGVASLRSAVFPTWFGW